MAPESERAKVCECIPLLAKCPVHGDKRPNPNEPTLTCSEVVERLAKIAEDEPIHYPDDGGPLHPHTVRSNIENKLREKSPAILHSWRERRVQELEELLAKRSGCSHCADSASGRIDK